MAKAIIWWKALVKDGLEKCDEKDELSVGDIVFKWDFPDEVWVPFEVVGEFYPKWPKTEENWYSVMNLVTFHESCHAVHTFWRVTLEN